MVAVKLSSVWHLVFSASPACLQLPFGIASDKFGRKPVILFGLSLFVLGAVIAALSTTVWGLLIGRAIQGAGAISAALTALLADTTPGRTPDQSHGHGRWFDRIEFCFLAMVVAPLLYLSIGMSGIFWLIASMALADGGGVVDYAECAEIDCAESPFVGCLEEY